MKYLSSTRRSVLALLIAIYSGGSAAEQLVGFSSDQGIPDTIFEQAPADKPWIQRKPAKKIPPLPATPQNVQQQNRLRALEKSLSEQHEAFVRLQGELKQQLLNNAQNQAQIAEKERALTLLKAELAELKNVESNRKVYQQDVERLQAELTSNKNELATKIEELAEFRLKYAAQLLHVDNLQIQQEAQSELLQKKQLELSQAEQKNSTLQSEVADLTAQRLDESAKLAALKKQLTKSELKPETHTQKLAYANGVAFANNIVQSLQDQKNLGLEVDRPMILAGINDAFARKTVLNVEEVKSLVEELDKTLNSQLLAQQDKERQLRDQQRELGKTFFAEKKKVKGMKQLDGALYRVIKSGNGEKLKPDSTIEFLLTGRLPDGTVFDNSGQENKVQQARIDSLLPAISQILSKVNPGSEIEIVLPPEKAFGEKGVTGLIPGNSTLIFDLKIIK
ncbi:FKBP-type peptidyl-prolyl cis-trans isomerase [Pantoea dispersa]|uniref:FKBP-type peptidyl-prolyl cis-trans isomerase n=1 Tax=Pantoea dispersa TaxID=59814 RepID=UPI0039B43053